MLNDKNEIKMLREDRHAAEEKFAAEAILRRQRSSFASFFFIQKNIKITCFFMIKKPYYDKKTRWRRKMQVKYHKIKNRNLNILV